MSLKNNAYCVKLKLFAPYIWWSMYVKVCYVSYPTKFNEKRLENIDFRIKFCNVLHNMRTKLNSTARLIE